ncbi:MAG: hypothetical protein EAX95_15650 [Candidatus Thorarchaeota archaeon]|nr:hypothetical protein [Candidatus Thorarchaeota archaeon]
MNIYAGRSDISYRQFAHAATNASRVVFSRVIEGLRYGSNPLLEMRIQDINIVADLSRLLVSYRGTRGGFDA